MTAAFAKEESRIMADAEERASRRRMSRSKYAAIYREIAQLQPGEELIIMAPQTPPDPALLRMRRAIEAHIRAHHLPVYTSQRRQPGLLYITRLPNAWLREM